MKNIFIFLSVLLNFTSQSQVHVRGYYKSNGTYVQPYERTRPNSTITDNYSYPGNYNPNKDIITPTPNLNSTNNSSYSTNTYNSDKVWVEGYFRSDGTFVNGYYRNSPSSNNSNNSLSNISESTYKYVKARKINVRASPSTNSEIYTTLIWNQKVKTLNTIENWTQVVIFTYSNTFNTFESIKGYINSSLLSESYNIEYTNNDSTNSNINSFPTAKNSTINTHYVVINYKAFFYTTPDKRIIKKAYLVKGERITSLIESKYFIYIVFRNVYGQTTKGWINKDDLLVQ